MDKPTPQSDTQIVREAAAALFKGYPSLSDALEHIANRLDRIEMFDAATACTAPAGPAFSALAEIDLAADLEAMNAEVMAAAGSLFSAVQGSAPSYRTDPSWGQPVAHPPVGAQVWLMSGGPQLTVIMSGAVCEVAWFDRDERLQEAAFPARALFTGPPTCDCSATPAQDA